MKKTIENSIKNSLENFEVPYNPDAWKAMSARLDVVKPVSTPRYKWYIAASAIVVASACGYLYYTGDNTSTETSRPEVAQENNTPTTINNSNSSDEQKHSSPAFTTTPNYVNDLDKNESAQKDDKKTNTSGDVAQVDPKENKGATDPKDEKKNKVDGTTPNVSPTVDPKDKDVAQISFITPDFKTKCENEKLVVQNENAINMSIIYPNGILWVAKPNSNTTIQLSQAGNYQVGYFIDNEFVKESDFTVLSAPEVDFDFVNEADKYDEKGLPSISVVANVNGEQFDWKFDDAPLSGKEVTGHFYNKGDHKVTLTITGDNGCENSIVKTVNIEENYTLMAMTSFVPTDIDPANNTFIPYSLKVRGDAFHMIILDPTDGHLVYETNDASRGWDGIDRQTGAMVKLESAYIWKVTILNPKEGESPEYAGTVTPISRRR